MSRFDELLRAEPQQNNCNKTTTHLSGKEERAKTKETERNRRGRHKLAVGGFDTPAPDAELGGARFQRIGLEYGPVSDGLTGLQARTYPTTACFLDQPG